MDIKKQSWLLPSKEDGHAFVVRTQAAEKDLCAALDLLDHVKESIPHAPASKTKSDIEDFLCRFRKK